LVKDWTHLPATPLDWSIKFSLLLAKEGAVPEAIDILERAKQTGPSSYELAFDLAGVYLLKSDSVTHWKTMTWRSA